MPLSSIDPSLVAVRRLFESCGLHARFTSRRLATGLARDREGSSSGPARVLCRAF
jgi:hypothetical protein